LAVGVLAKIPQQVNLEARHVGSAGGEPQQPAREIFAAARLAAERKRRAKPPQRLVPGIGVEGVEKVGPRHRGGVGYDARVVRAGRVILLLPLAWWTWTFLARPMRQDVIGASFLHLISLPFHEAGHLLFSPFG